ncbi:hypothetical protein DY218_28635 [Streptomyces triticagri]|uniref:Uncharacterized protein n=1 Tax=Streptomyces triticagri TaxID=2293568 RepID=A0A372LXA2_9ACTN|nr:hypothetical protein [Streptomyces triticagri]RFU83276.1 hypothetical protein DY218_28635 [Streptomyces triticagri]
MSIKVTTHRLFGHRSVLRAIQDAAPLAADLVRTSVPGRLPHTEIILTTPSGVTDLTIRAAEQALGRRITPQARAEAEREMRRNDRRNYGSTVLARRGTVVILLNARKLTDPQHLGATLVHELVHAMQFTRPGIHDLLVKGLRNNYGIEPLSRRDVRAYERQLDAHEEEAYRMEAALAPRLAHRLAA